MSENEQWRTPRPPSRHTGAEKRETTAAATSPGWAAGRQVAAAGALLCAVLAVAGFRYLAHVAANYDSSSATNMTANDDYKSATSVYDFVAKTIKGENVPLEKYKGHVLLIVNVASKCGLTATNYKELNELYDEYAESKGLRILAFPCNQFNGQEPGGAEDICSFADRQKVKFDLFEKIDVNGDNAHPLWKYLKKEKGGTLGSFIKWNFTKFIVDKKGAVVERHGPNVDPSKLRDNLEEYF